MSIFQHLQRAIEEKDVDLWCEVYHDDFQFIRHQSGSAMNKEQVRSMLNQMLNSDAFVQTEHRCIYENEDVLIEHSFMTFPDNTKEAVLVVHNIQDGKIIRTETGATTIKT